MKSRRIMLKQYNHAVRSPDFIRFVPHGAYCSLCTDGLQTSFKLTVSPVSISQILGKWNKQSREYTVDVVQPSHYLENPQTYYHEGGVTSKTIWTQNFSTRRCTAYNLYFEIEIEIRIVWIHSLFYYFCAASIPIFTFTARGAPCKGWRLEVVSVQWMVTRAYSVFMIASPTTNMKQMSSFS